MILLTIFIIALLLVTGAVEPSGHWFVTLAVLAGIDLLLFSRRRSPFRIWRMRRWEPRSWANEWDW